MPNQEFTNTLYTNDNLFILSGLNSDLVDLIYLDPPFNSKRFYSTPIGSKKAKASFTDMWSWQDVNEEYLNTLAEKYPALTDYIASVSIMHDKAMAAYLTYMAQRIIEMHRVLKDTGSFYLHCDQTASHFLKGVLDEIFGKKNFRNEIIWKRGRMKGAKAVSSQYGRNHDVILYYSKSKNYTYNRQYINYSEEYVKQRYTKDDNDGRGPYTDQPIGTRSQESIEKFREEGRIFKTAGNTERVKFYLSDMKGIAMDDVWIDIDELNSMAKDNKYPTQKPLPLLYRIIKTSSNEGDLVFDPFCGCATTCVAAQQLDRKWIGIDISEKAVDLLVERLSDDAGMFKDFVNTSIIPQRTDLQTISDKNPDVKKQLYKEQKGCCNGCGTEFDIWNMEIDHKLPKSKGGGNYYENYQLLCGSCNKIKGDRPMEYLRMKIATRKKLLKDKIIFGE